MAEARIVTAARRFKAELERREKRQMWEMARRWREVEVALRADIQALAEEIARLTAGGLPVTPHKLYQLERYQRLLAQTQTQFARYAQWASGLVTAQQRAWSAMALEHAVALLDAQAATAFDLLPLDVVAYLVGVCGDGEPVWDLMLRRMVRDEAGLPLPGLLERLTRTLITATARGFGPSKIALLLEDDLAGGLQKAMVIARTEQLRAYREAARAQFQATGKVIGYRRIAALDDRTCLACMLLDGHIYPLHTPLPDHPQGRCEQIPILDGENPPEWQTGRSWLLAQDSDTQRRLMGVSRWRLWQAGDLDLDEMAVHTYDDTWGGGVAVVPLPPASDGKAARAA